MRIQAIHPNFILPTKGSEGAAAFDLYMPEAGQIGVSAKVIDLGFAAEVPKGHVALLLPRSSTGAKKGVELNNTCGVIDPDYRGEWRAFLKTKDGNAFSWAAGERVLQFLIVPVASVELELVDSVEMTARGAGGFGSTGA